MPSEIKTFASSEGNITVRIGAKAWIFHTPEDTERWTALPSSEQEQLRQQIALWQRQ